MSIIRNRQVAEIKYKNEEFKRKIQIYTLGINKSGNLVIRAFQQSGYSHTQNNGWKLFCVENILFINPLNETFILHPNYKKDDKAFNNIISQI